MGGRGAEHIEHTQTGMFNVLRGDIRWERHQARQQAQMGLLSCLADGVGLGREWMVLNTSNTPRRVCSRWDVGWEGEWAGAGA